MIYARYVITHAELASARFPAAALGCVMKTLDHWLLHYLNELEPATPRRTALPPTVYTCVRAVPGCDETEFVKMCSP